MRPLSIIFTAVLCFALVGGACAQRQLPGMRGIQITGGMVDGFYSSKTQNITGFYLGTAMTVYAKNGNKWIFGGEYLQRIYPYREMCVPLIQFTAEAGYYFRFLSDPTKTVNISFGGSVLAGYETSNWGKKTLYDGSTLQDRDAFIYGIAPTLEVETYLTDCIVLLLNARERILWGNSTGHFHSQLSMGIKIIIN